MNSILDLTVAELGILSMSMRRDNVNKTFRWTVETVSGTVEGEGHTAARALFDAVEKIQRRAA